MAVYQNTVANLGVRLTITHAAPNISGNSTTITYKAEVYKTGSHNPWNNLNQTPMYLTINGVSLHSTSTGNYDLRGGTTAQTIKSGTLVIPHDADGSKTFSFSWRSNFTSTGYGYGDVTTSGSYALPTIPRASTFSVSTASPTTGSNFTVTISPASDTFRHDVSYIVNNSETISASKVATSATLNIPHSVFNANKDVDTIAAMVRVRTYNGTTLVGTNTSAINVNLVSSATPTVSNIKNTNSNKGPFTSENQYIRGVSKMTVTSTGTGSYSSTISAYEYRLVRGDTSANVLTVSKTSGSHTYDVFDFPASGSITLQIQARVRDSRGRYSAWTNGTLCRLHYYKAPTIGNMTVRRVGASETTLQVTRNYNVTGLYEGGGTTNSNTANLSFQHRVKGTTTATNNTGAGSTVLSLVNSNANLALTFASNTSYEVRAVLKDSIQTVYSSWLTVGTVFVPFDIGPKGAAAGKAHSDGSYDFEVGTGGLNNEGLFRYNGNSIQHHTLTHATSGAAITVTGDWNNVIQTGFYQGSSMTNASPGSHTWRWVRVTRHNDLFVLQEAFSFDGATSHYRTKVNGTWSGWKNLDPTSEFISKPSSSDDLNTMTQSGAYRLAGNNANGFPNYAYGQMLTIHGGNDTIAQLGFPYNYPTNPNMYLRAGNPSNVGGSGNYSAWRMIPSSESGSTANGSWYRIGDYQVCTQNFSIAGLYSAYTLTGTWTYPKSFTGNPIISATPRTNLTDPAEIMNGTLSVLGTPTSTSVEFAWMRQSGANFTANSRKYLSVFAIGKV